MRTFHSGTKNQGTAIYIPQISAEILWGTKRAIWAAYSPWPPDKRGAIPTRAKTLENQRYKPLPQKTSRNIQLIPGLPIIENCKTPVLGENSIQHLWYCFMILLSFSFSFFPFQIFSYSINSFFKSCLIFNFIFMFLYIFFIFCFLSLYSIIYIYNYI